GHRSVGGDIEAGVDASVGIQAQDVGLRLSGDRVDTATDQDLSVRLQCQRADHAGYVQVRERLVDVAVGQQARQALARHAIDRVEIAAGKDVAVGQDQQGSHI